MRGSGVTAARSCLQPLVSASRYLAIHALPGDPLYFVVEAKSRVKEVYAQTCVLLGQQGMRDCELFGLAILSDGEYLFVDPESKLSKYAPKNWRSSHTYGLDSSGRPAFVLYCRVRYYVDTPLLLSDETTRHHYYLQLRDNVVRHGGGVESLHPHHPLHSTSIVAPLLALAGLALQADLGDYAEERHRPHAGSVGYCKPSDYLPPHMCLESDVLSILASQHRENHGLSREEAEFQYIQDAVLLEAPVNAHLYRLRRNKSEAGPGRILLAICARGVRVYIEEATPRIFAWNNIGKLCFDRKKFEIRAVDQPDKLTLYSGCDDKSKLLLGLCRDTHQFSMAIAPRVTEAKRREEEERKVLRDCYMYPVRCKLSMAARGSRGDQRISVISSTSSTTTSGIVSDRVHSEDEPDTAPASTECLPRLTDASNNVHYGTSFPKNGKNVNCSMNGESISRPVSPVSAVDEVDGADSTPATMITSRHNINSTLATDGSQCSSSCSTVVVVNQLTNSSSHRARRASATSSLELGYSHTAQNSAVSSSETATFPGAIYDRCKKLTAYADTSVTMNIDDTFAITDIASETSGIYTLRGSAIQDERITELYSANGDTNDSSVASDVCAMSSVQSTTDEASVTSGFYTIHSDIRSETSDVYTIDASNMDQEEPFYSICKGYDDDDDNGKNGDDDDDVNANDDNDNDHNENLNVVGSNVISMNNSMLNHHHDDSRSRSNSILSAGSFRGDGSDPSDIGPLLSADELTDLIVGRYPPRKTVSTSMDSDCDYVTMPAQSTAAGAPPPPPPRTDSNERYLPPPPPYPSNIKYATINSSRSFVTTNEREQQPPLPPPPYNAVRGDFVPLPPRRSEPPPPPPPYTSSRERIQIPPPTPPRNDAVTPREPPPPPPYPDIPSSCQEAISKLYPACIDDNGTGRTREQTINQRINATRHTTKTASTINGTLVSSVINDCSTKQAPKPPPRIQPPTYPGDKMKPTPVHAPVAALVVGPNNYLDVHATRGNTTTSTVLSNYLASSAPPPPPLPPPPMLHPRQPPPPPPPPTTTTPAAAPLAPTSTSASSLATVYTSQVTRSQIEQYRQQLYSDVDFVMFPLKDPAVSKQEYMDAKQGSILAAMAAYPPPPYPAFNGKSSVVYRSTPYLPGSSFSSSNQTKYASNLNLSDTSSNNYPIIGGVGGSGGGCGSNLSSHYAASTSSLYSGATCSSSVGSHSLRREPPVPVNPYTLNGFARTRSDENILKCFETPANTAIPSITQTKHRRLPPPPPPPPYEIQSLEKNQPLPSASSSSTALTQMRKSTRQTSFTNERKDDSKNDGMLDIRTLREKSRNLDLPLISALCNDRYLIKQTKAFVMPKHPSDVITSVSGVVGTLQKTSIRSMTNGAVTSSSSSSRNKYPVSGLSTTQITKPPRKSTNSTHRHPAETRCNAYKVTTSATTSTTTSTTTIGMSSSSSKKDLTRASHS